MTYPQSAHQWPRGRWLPGAPVRGAGDRDHGAAESGGHRAQRGGAPARHPGVLLQTPPDTGN